MISLHPQCFLNAVFFFFLKKSLINITTHTVKIIKYAWGNNIICSISVFDESVKLKPVFSFLSSLSFVRWRWSGLIEHHQSVICCLSLCVNRRLISSYCNFILRFIKRVRSTKYRISFIYILNFECLFQSLRFFHHFIRF